MKRKPFTSALLLVTPLILTACADFHDSYPTADGDSSTAYARPLRTKPAYTRFDRPVAVSAVKAHEGRGNRVVSTARSRTEAAAEAPVVKTVTKTKAAAAVTPAVPADAPAAAPMAPTVGQ